LVLVSATSVRRGWRSAAGCAFWPIGADASLIALLQYLPSRGSDRPLISHRHRCDFRLVFLEDAALTFK
jgi:hypothetical protein